MRFMRFIAFTCYGGDFRDETAERECAVSSQRARFLASLRVEASIVIPAAAPEQGWRPSGGRCSPMTVFAIPHRGRRAFPAAASEHREGHVGMDRLSPHNRNSGMAPSGRVVPRGARDDGEQVLGTPGLRVRRCLAGSRVGQQLPPLGFPASLRCSCWNDMRRTCATRTLTGHTRLDRPLSGLQWHLSCTGTSATCLVSVILAARPSLSKDISGWGSQGEILIMAGVLSRHGRREGILRLRSG